MAITRNKASQLGLILSDEAVEYIAENITANVRQIEGVIKRLTAYREILDDTIDIDSVKRAIKDVTRIGNVIPTPAVIIKETARWYQLSEEELRGQNRSKNVASARQISMREQAFLNGGLHISTEDQRPGRETRDEMCYQGGIREFVAYINRNKEPLHPDVIYMSGEKDDGLAEVALQWNNSYNEVIASFANNIHTPEGGMTTREEDYVETVFAASTHDHILFFTNLGRVYVRKGYKIPRAERSARGGSIVNILPLEPGEKIATMLKLKKAGYREMHQYYAIMQEDFSKDELVPEIVFQKALLQHTADLVLVVDDTIKNTIAYALVCPKSLYGYGLLWFFAVLPWYRGRGLGTEAMKLINQKYGRLRGMVPSTTEMSASLEGRLASSVISASVRI